MAEERKVQLGFAVDANSVKPGLNEIKQDVRDMARDVEQSGQRAGQGLSKIGDGAPEASRKVEGATRSIIGSIERATAAMQAGTKGSAEYYEALAKQRGVSADVIKPYIDQLKQAEKAQEVARSSLGKMEMSAAATSAALRGVPAQFTDIITSLQGGQAPLTVFLQQGGQLKDMFGGAGAAARALGGYVLGLVNPFSVAAAGVATLGYAYAQGSKEADAYRMALVTTGNAAGTTSGQLKAYAQEIAGVIGTQGKAAESLATLAGSGKVANEVLREAAQASIAYERATGQAASKTAEMFASLAGDPVKAVLKLNESMNFLTESTYRQIKSLEDQGRAADAAAVAQRAYADALTSRSGEIERNLGSIERGWLNVKNMAKAAWDAMLNVGRADTNEDKLASINKQIAELEKRRAGGFGETEGGAAMGRPSSAAQARVQAELAALGAQKAAIEGVLHAERERGKQEADNAANRKLYFDWDQKGAAFATKAQQRDAEILRARTEGQQLVNAGLITQAQLEERVGAIRKKYEEKPSSGAAGTGQNEVAAIRAKIAETERYLAALQEQGAEAEKLTEGEKLVIKIQEELKTSISGVARAQKEKALAAAQTLAALDRQVVQEQELSKANAKAEAEYRKGIAAMADKTDAIDKQARELEAANATFGKSKIAIEEYTAAQKQDQLAKLQALGLQGEFTAELEREIAARKRLTEAMREAAYKSANAKFDEALTQAREQNDLVREEISLIGLTEVERKKIIAAREVEIELAKELREIEKLGLDDAQSEELRIKARAKARTKAETAQAKATLDEWQKTSDDINRALTDSLFRAFESGKDFGETLRDSLKAMFNTLVLRPIISAVMQPVSMVINGLTQSALGAFGLGGGNGGMLGMASNGLSAYNMFTGVGGNMGALSGWWGGTMSGANAAGSIFANTVSATGATDGLSALLMTNNAYGTGTGAASAAGAGWAAAGYAAVAALVLNALGAFRSDAPVGGGLRGTLGAGNIRPYELWREGGTLFDGPNYSINDRGAEIERLEAELRRMREAGDGSTEGAYNIQRQLDALRGQYGDQLDAAIQQGKAIDTAFIALRTNTLQMAEVLGIGTDALQNWTTTLGSDVIHPDTGGIGLSLTDLSQEEVAKKIAEALATANNELAEQLIGSWVTTTETTRRTVERRAPTGGDTDIPGIWEEVEETLTSTRYVASEYAREGEQAIDTLTRLATSLSAVNTVFERLGVTLRDPSLAGGAESSGLIDAMGGPEAFSATMQGYYEAYYSQAEQAGVAVRDLSQGFAELGAVMPGSRDELRGMISAALEAGESGHELAAGLLGLSQGFGQFGDYLMSLSGLTNDSIKSIFRNILEQASSVEEAQRMGAEAFETLINDSLQNAMLTGLSDMVMSGMVAPLMESLLAGAVASSAAMASGGATAAAAMATGGAVGASAAAQGGAAAAGAMASGGSAAGAAMAGGGAAAGAIVAGVVEQARAYIGAFGQIMSDPSVQAGIRDISGMFGAISGDLFAATPTAGGGGFVSPGSPSAPKSDGAGELAEAMRQLAEVIGEEIKRLTEAMYEFDPVRERETLMAEFAIVTGQARAGDKDALEKLPELSRAIEQAMKLTAASAFDLNATRGWLASSLEDTLKALKLDLPKFDVGTNYVPRTMAAIVHEGEAIVPKAFNPWAGGGAAAGGDQQTASEVRALREDLRVQAGQIVRLQAQTFKLLREWDGNGLPSERVEEAA